MAKTAMNQLEDQVELIRREAYAAGYAAACRQSARLQLARLQPRRHRRGAVDCLANHCRLPARRDRHPPTASPPRNAPNGGRIRGWSRKYCERSRRGRSARARSAPPYGATRVCHWRTRRSAMRWDSWKAAKRFSRMGADSGSRRRQLPDDRGAQVRREIGGRR
jgi:hypothetical protein